VRDREEDLRRVERGELVLTEGHQTPATTVVDGDLDEVLDMPSDSPWPIALAGMLGIVTVFLLTGHWTTAVVFAGAAAAIVGAWHWTEAEADRVAPARRAAPNGLWGMAIFLCTEVALFGSIIGTYFYLRFTSHTWPQGGIPAPHAVLPLCLAALLVLSCLPMLGASVAARRGGARAAWGLIALAALMQACYLAVQILSFRHDLSDFSPTTNAYGSIYFTMLGAHHIHVIVGLLLDAWLLVRLTGGLTSYRRSAVRAVSLYWYVIAAVGVAVTLVQVSPS
jgi:heme/copper-type cytochrome/quinol oxidase subunit 3